LHNKKTSKHGKSNTTKVWEHQMIRRHRNISRTSEHIPYNLDMRMRKMMNLLIYVSIRRKRMIESNG
jgi:hypothetical protein